MPLNGMAAGAGTSPNELPGLVRGQRQQFRRSGSGHFRLGAAQLRINHQL